MNSLSKKPQAKIAQASCAVETQIGVIATTFTMFTNMRKTPLILLFSFSVTE